MTGLVRVHAACWHGTFSTGAHLKAQGWQEVVHLRARAEFSVRLRALELERMSQLLAHTGGLVTSLLLCARQLADRLTRMNPATTCEMTNVPAQPPRRKSRSIETSSCTAQSTHV